MMRRPSDKRNFGRDLKNQKNRETRFSASSQSETKNGDGKSSEWLLGFHAVRLAWLNPARECLQLCMTAQAQKEFQKTLGDADDRNLKRPTPQIVDRTDIDKLAPGQVHQGIAIKVRPLQQPDLKQFLKKNPQRLVLLDQVTDPHNVGAILRSAAALGADAVVVTERHSPQNAATLAKAASGALDVLPLISVPNLAQAMETMKQDGFWTIGLAGEAEKSLPEHDLTGKVAIVLGAEGDGLRQLTRQRCDFLARLPTLDTFGTLNVSNAAAVALYILSEKKK